MIAIAIFSSATFTVPALTYAFGKMAANNDTTRRTYQLNYDLDALAQNRLSAIESVVSILSRNATISFINSQIETTDHKRYSGSTKVDSYTDAKVERTNPPLIYSNVIPYCLDLGRNYQKLYFMPDRIYVYQDGADGAVEYGAIEYKELEAIS